MISFTVAGVGESTVGGGGGEIDDRCMDCRSGHMYSHRLLKEVEAVKDESGEGIILVSSVLSLGYHYYCVYSIQ